MYSFHYPNEVDFQKAVQVGFHELYQMRRRLRLKKLQQGGKIGIILNLTPSYPRSQHPRDVEAAEMADAFFNRSFLDPAVKGISRKS